MKVRARNVAIAHGALLVAALTVAALADRTADWKELGMFLALLFLAAGSDLVAIQVRGLHLSGTFAAVLIACVLLGPVPAILVALAPIAINALRERPPALNLLSNVTTYTVFPLVGALLARGAGVEGLSDEWMAVVVMANFMLVNFLNFVLIYGYRVMAEGWSWRDGFRDMYSPVVPAQLGIAALTVGVIYAERYLGPAAIVVFAPNVLIFQWLLRTAIAAFERGRELVERNRELAALQFGLISSMLRTLALRDHMTARHSAAVARYARAMAQEIGLPESEQELIHTAALFHDIGKFIFPDSILLSKRRLTDEEYAIVRRHPEVGADVIAGIEGYDAVAKIVLHHHERPDGRGYPHGLISHEIPLGAKIIAVADTYDVITARDTYQDPRPMVEAFAELRRVSGSQLDGELVELFIRLMTERGVVFRHAEAEDFEAELAIERRVSDYANPRQAA